MKYLYTSDTTQVQVRQVRLIIINRKKIKYHNINSNTNIVKMCTGLYLISSFFYLHSTRVEIAANFLINKNNLRQIDTKTYRKNVTIHQKN